jgi:broad specificity phosphatase PhoE
MSRRTLLALAAAIALSPALCAQTKPPVVHVIRHFDTPAGERDPALTDVGTKRAEALVRWFAGKPLTAIYVTNFKRTQATVAPLAAERGLTPTLYGPTPDAGLIDRLRAENGAVLVVGHSNTVPNIVAALGGEKPSPLSHPDFGDVWTIADGATTRARVEP